MDRWFFSVTLAQAEIGKLMKSASSPRRVGFAFIAFTLCVAACHPPAADIS
jgi:hypothetical protein